MLSKAGWETLWEAVPIDEYVNSSPEKQSEGFLKFVEIWQKDNGVDIDIYDCSSDGIYFDLERGCSVKYPNGELDEDLLIRYCDYLLRD
jgi:hypothetical protein